MMNALPIFLPGEITRYQADDYARQGMWYPGDNEPGVFFDFALKDMLDSPSERAHVNAISNAKRALHLQVENLCFGFGAAGLDKKLKNFPSRLEFLERIGIARPRILKKINSLRNIVEHEYKIPNAEEAHDFVDIVGLFLDATKVYRYNQPCDVENFADVFDLTGEYVLVRLCANFRDGELTIMSKKNGAARLDEIRQIISVNDMEYFEWVKMVLRNDI
jgi:hypothetical protein